MPDPFVTHYNRIRQEEYAARQDRIRDAFSRAPELSALSALRTQVMKDVGTQAISASIGAQRLDEIAVREREILASLRLPADYMELHYRCPLCRDTGYTGESRRERCVCSLKLSALCGVDPQVNDRETFQSFSEEIYADAQQKKRTVNAKKICESYAAALPRPEKPNLLLLGMPGLGKSFLGNAIAYAALDRAIDTQRVTAYHFVQDMLSDIRDNTHNAKRYQSVPLLVLDDLGSEPEIKNVSCEWLFAIINERVSAKLATVIATNLTLTALQDRYGERFMSRISDTSTTAILSLTGKNLRLK